MKTFSYLIFAFVLTIFLVGTISAMEIDNWKSYDSINKEVTITNAFGLGTELAKIRLDYNSDTCLINCEANLYLDLKQDYPDALKYLKFYRYEKEKLVEVDLKEYVIQVRTGSYVEENPYDVRMCADQINKINCITEKRIRKVTRYIYEDFNDADLKAGKYYLKIRGKKNAGETIEWIPTFLGKEIDEWAIWGAGFNQGLFAYYNMSSNLTSVGSHHLLNVGTPLYTLTNALVDESVNLTVDGNELNLPGDVDAFNMVNAKNTSLVFWFAPQNTTLGEDGWLISNYGAGGGGITQQGIAGTKIYSYKWIVDAGDWTSNAMLEQGKWTYVAITRNSSSACIQINVSGGSNQQHCETPAGTVIDDSRLLEYGTSTVDRDFVGMMDEIGWWNRTLSQSEITDLYNDGNGLTYDDVSPLGVTISLSAPSDNYETINTTTFFSSNFTMAGGNMSNATLFVWNPDGTLFKTNSTLITEISNSTNLSLSGFSVGAHPWNYFGCGTNSSSYNCSFYTTNRTLNIVSYEINNEFWNNQTTEGNIENFILNISVAGSLQVSTANLNYNGTNYAGTLENVGGGVYSIRRKLLIPPTTTAINNTFFWDIDMSDDSNLNSTSHNQSVFNFGLDNCSSNSLLILNYSLNDEEIKTLINGTLYNSTIEVDVQIFSYGGINQITNYSGKVYNQSNNHAPICISSNALNNTQYSMSSVVRYDSDQYAAEFYNIQNFTLTNITIPQNISLYELKDVDSTTFLITFKDVDYLPEEDALIQITRKYVSDGIFRTVEIPKTDSSGQTTGHFDTDNVVYTIIVTKNGITKATFSNIVVVCEDAVIGNCKLNLNAASGGTPFTTWDEIGKLSYDISFSKTNRKITTTFTTTDGSTRTVSVNTTKFDRFGNNTICTDSLSSSSGTLICDVPPTFGNLTMVSKLYSEGELVTTKTFTIAVDPTETFGTDAIVFVLVLVLTLPLLMITDTIGMIFGAFVGLIVAGLLLFYNTGSYLGPTSAMIWFLIAGGIIVWKIWRLSK